MPGANGYVNAISEPDSNGTRYLGGSFTASDCPAGPAAARQLCATSGAVDLRHRRRPVSRVRGLRARSASAASTSAAASPASVARRANNAAHINAVGSLDSSRAPNVNNSVNALAISGSTVYLGGHFTTVGGTTRNRAAAVGTDGTLDTNWNPNLNIPRIGARGFGINRLPRRRLHHRGRHDTQRCGGSGNRRHTRHKLEPKRRRSYSAPRLRYQDQPSTSAGSFATVGGVDTINSAAAVGTDGVLTSWNPNVDSGTVRALAVSGSTVYLGGTFTTVGGTTRNCAAAVGADGALDTSWDPNVNGDSEDLRRAIARFWDQPSTSAATSPPWEARHATMRRQLEPTAHSTRLEPKPQQRRVGARGVRINRLPRRLLHHRGRHGTQPMRRQLEPTAHSQAGIQTSTTELTRFPFRGPPSISAAASTPSAATHAAAAG